MTTKAPLPIRIYVNSGLFGAIKNELTAMNTADSLAFLTKLNALSNDAEVYMIDYPFNVTYDTWLKPANVISDSTFKITRGHVIGRADAEKQVWILPA